MGSGQLRHLAQARAFFFFFSFFFFCVVASQVVFLVFPWWFLVLFFSWCVEPWFWFVWFLVCRKGRKKVNPRLTVGETVGQ